MKEKRDCKIVQDLLPNYIEKLTNEETNIFIEEHLKECDECKKILENMKKDIKIDAKVDKREVNYFKKYSKKLKILRRVLLLIIVVVAIVIGRRLLILTSLTNKAYGLRDSNKDNYYAKLYNYREGNLQTTEIYKKGEDYLLTVLRREDEYFGNKFTFYKSGNEKFSLMDYKDRKVINRQGMAHINLITFAGESFIENLCIAVSTGIHKVNLHGTECYMIKMGNEERFIEKETGLAIKCIDNNSNSVVDYEYKFGVVSEIERPDTTGYAEATE